MQKYGILVGGKLSLNSKQLEGYKPVEYTEIPNDFNQTTHYITQSEPIDNGAHIFIGNEMHVLKIDEGGGFEDFIPGGIN